ncbi:hypothetical protein MUN82_19050 [Hymenobacter aerilatus]|uniref:Transglutaminase-like domain-containing protein n=1 Tax=Hymenobacter aerilatus TaxID=2932251 RepID=A0A8T9SSC5_9BACT|nr:transglutaminase domain-containing protein [Hymenobacter aerilatus]UOR05022.1 hypothetical protein MUN82_19050 [Hymenobacter aerilatus]
MYSLSLLLLTATAGLAQQKGKVATTPVPAPYAAVDKLALLLPDTAARSPRSMARYINSTFSTDTDKARAIYIWLARNVRYDVEKGLAINFYANTEELITKTLATRTGICQDYAEVFTTVAQLVGLPAYTISGYTKQAGYVDYVPHAWCTARLDGTWYLFDPTWGAGYVRAGQFVQRTNEAYFKTQPQQLISNHMPFDPLWQLLPYPITNPQFCMGKASNPNLKTAFSFVDSIQLYQQQDTLTRLRHASRRIQANGIKDPVVYNMLTYNQQIINNYVVDNGNRAIYFYNEGVRGFNAFIEYRNAQFLPKKTDEEIRAILLSPSQNIQQAQRLLAPVMAHSSNTQNQSLLLLQQQLQRDIRDVADKILEQQAFVDKYCATSKLLRRSLFYSGYTVFGIPVK